jgi:methylenetetrahydrofolate dehydrogenase (NADP+)/methenyltetrahydrofolate cyclohydrolase
MTATVISGTQVAADIRAELKERVAKVQAKGVNPALAVVLVGEDPASVSYVTSKARGAEEIGMFEETIRLPADTSEEEVIKTVDRLNKDPKFHGILVQLPLPKHINSEKIISLISPEKDVDGFHPVNQGKLLRGEPCPLPCTPHGVQELLMRSGNDPSGKYVVICGRSNLVGKPLAGILMQKKKGANATVTVCHTGTKDMVITADMIRDGAVVIDVGVNRVEDKTREKGFRLVGDVDFEPIKEKASFITPVPGGVGPMTVTMLLMNTVEIAERLAGMGK